MQVEITEQLRSALIFYMFLCFIGMIITYYDFNYLKYGHLRMAALSTMLAATAYIYIYY